VAVSIPGRSLSSGFFKGILYALGALAAAGLCFQTHRKAVSPAFRLIL